MKLNHDLTSETPPHTLKGSIVSSPDRNRDRDRDRERGKDKEELPPQWEKIHGAIWLIGLAILFWQGWIFPGIFVLIAISALTQAAIIAYVNKNKETQALATARELHLPEHCPNCGGPLNTTTVRWNGSQTAICPFCGSTVKAIAKVHKPSKNAP